MTPYEDKFITTELFIALFKTASEGKTTKVLTCLDEGANINERFINYSNNTPLHICVMMQDLEVIKLLLKRGAKTDYRNHENKTALDVATELDSDVGQAIIKLLKTHKSKTQADTNKKTKYTFRKRDCTSGIEGKFYETKLITLIQIRSLIKEYEQFYIGTNLAGIGALDDICVRYKDNNEDVVIFLQAKHRNKVTKGEITSNALWQQTGDFSLFQYFDSYLNIRERFNDTKNSDVIFNGKYEDLKCYMIIYTSGGNKLNDKRTARYCSTDKKVSDLIRSGASSDILQYQYMGDEVDLLTKSTLVKEMQYLGKTIVNLREMKNTDFMLADRHIRKYHVLLAQNVLNISDVNSAEQRTGTFRDDFFSNTDELLVALKEALFNEAVIKIDPNRGNIKELVQAVVKKPTSVAVSELMQKLLIRYDYKTNTLVTTDKNTKNIAKELSDIKIGYNVYEEAYKIAVKKKLTSITIKLPAIFGNIDISVSDDNNDAIECLSEILAKDKNVIINEELIGSNTLIDAGGNALNKFLKSALGNLLILSEEDESLKFNMNYKTLHNNAKMLLKLLMSKISDLDAYRIRLDIKGLPKLSLKADARDKLLAKDFFDNLWFYTNQAKEDEIEGQCKNILEEYCITKYISARKSTNIRYDLMYLKIHDDVQKWWMLEGELDYLNDSKYFKDIIRYFLYTPLLSILSGVYMDRMNSYHIEFDKVSVQSLCTQFRQASTVIVVTEVVLLTGIKLVQHFQTLNDYAFIQLDSLLLLSVNDRNVLIEDINHRKLQTVIIIYGDISEFKSELFRCLIKEITSTQLIIIIDTHSYKKLQTFVIDDKWPMVPDKGIEFNDLVPISQKKVLSSTLIFQGTEISFNTVIKEDAKYLIKPCILQKIINNEKIEVGRTLSNPNYEEIKYYFIDRQLKEIDKESKEELFSQSVSEQLKAFNKLKTFEVINDTVVLAGAPGSGKSTFLTHMSIKTKQRNPKIWIERINLLDYTKEFHRWQDKKVNIDRIEALKFVCKSAISKITSKNIINFDENVFDLEIVNGELLLRNYKEITVLDYFELLMFIYCYNKGNTVLLFDGFDKICPDYKEDIIKLLKCLVTTSMGVNSFDRSSHKQRIWIASRSYNNIVVSLHTEFGILYDLKEITVKELKISMKKYFKINLNLNELNYDQFINIDGFLEYMEKNGELYFGRRKIKTIKYYNVLLLELYFTAVEYLLSETNYIDFTPEKSSLVEKWQSRYSRKHEVCLFNLVCVMKGQYENKSLRKKALPLRITPIYMYCALEHFTNELKNIAFKNTNKVLNWDFEANTSSFYKDFLETQLKKRLFHQNQMDLYNPDVRRTYDRELKEFLDKHKKIAFYATYFGELEDLLTQVEIDEMRKIIWQFEAGVEKTDVVDYIINGVPKFIHPTFQEYLTAEYVIDLFKTKPNEKTKLWNFITKSANIYVLEFIGLQLKCDNELKNFFEGDKTKLSYFNAIIEEDTHSLQFMLNKASPLVTSKWSTIFKWFGHIVFLFCLYFVSFYLIKEINE